jgi:hypothetical protein
VKEHAALSTRICALDEFYRAYSAYVDGFLTRRSVLSASLFPEKPSQMYFGYAWTEQAAVPITEWLADHLPARELGERFRCMRTQGTALTVTGVLWTYLMGLLGLELTDKPWSQDVARGVLGYWQEVFEVFTALCDPPSRPPERHETYARFHMLDAMEAARVAESVTPAPGEAIQATVAAAANYSWLLECESRQGTFNHGLYDIGNRRRLLVKEFVDLSGRFYPWVDQDAAELPRGPVAIVLLLCGVEARFDAFAVPSLDPESYGERLEGVAVITDRGVEPDPVAWLQALADELARAHRSLFRTIMRWTPRDRYYGGARSYARIWADILEVAGATPEDVERLAFDSVDAFTEEHLDAHLAREGDAPIWPWVSDPARPTVFEPVLGPLCSGA